MQRSPIVHPPRLPAYQRPHPPPTAACRKTLAPRSQDKAHKLGDVVIKQEAANKELQRQLATLQEAQAAALQAALAGGGEALAPADLAAVRQQLVLAHAQLQRQAEELDVARADYETRQALLKQAAGGC